MPLVIKTKAQFKDYFHGPVMFHLSRSLLVYLLCLLLLSACGGGGSSEDENGFKIPSSDDGVETEEGKVYETTQSTYQVNGLIRGVDEPKFITLNNKETIVVKEDGVFEFSSKLLDKDNYLVELLTDDSSCVVNSGSGVVSGASITNIVIDCDVPTAPTEPKLVLVSGISTDQISATWLLSTDDTTPQADLQYEVHLSLEAAFISSQSTLVATVSNLDYFTFTSLETQTDYYIQVIAIDQDLERSKSEIVSVATLSADIEINDTVTITESDSLSLSAPVMTETSLTYYLGSDSVPETFTVGSIVLGTSASGDLFLRKIASLSESNGELTIETTKAAINEVFTRGEFQSSILLEEDTQVIASSTKSSSAFNTTPNHYQSSNGYFDVRRAEEKISSRSASKASSSSDVRAEVNFEPRINTQLEWETSFSGIKFNKGQIEVGGQLETTIDTEYNYTESESIKKEITIFSTAWTYKIPTAPLPLIGRARMKIKAVLTGEVAAKLDAKTHAAISVYLSVTANYNAETGAWDTQINEPEIKKAITASLELAGTADLEIRIVPTISVSAYELVFGAVSIEPYLKASAGKPLVS